MDRVLLATAGALESSLRSLLNYKSILLCRLDCDSEGLLNCFSRSPQIYVTPLLEE